MAIKMIKIWTDGSCDVHGDKTGSWAYIIELPFGGKVEDGGIIEHTTNNQMEMHAIWEALMKVDELKLEGSIVVYSDSEWAINCIKGIYDCRKDKSKYHILLLDAIDYLIKHKTIEFIHVYGHADNEYNLAVDELAGIVLRKREENVKNKQDTS